MRKALKDGKDESKNEEEEKNRTLFTGRQYTRKFPMKMRQKKLHIALGLSLYVKPQMWPKKTILKSLLKAGVAT